MISTVFTDTIGEYAEAPQAVVLNGAYARPFTHELLLPPCFICPVIVPPDVANAPRFVLAFAAVVAPVPPFATGKVPEILATGNVPDSVAADIPPFTSKLPLIMALPTTCNSASGAGVLMPTFCLRNATSGVPCFTTKYKSKLDSEFSWSRICTWKS